MKKLLIILLCLPLLFGCSSENTNKSENDFRNKIINEFCETIVDSLQINENEFIEICDCFRKKFTEYFNKLDDDEINEFSKDSRQLMDIINSCQFNSTTDSWTDGKKELMRDGWNMNLLTQFQPLFAKIELEKEKQEILLAKLTQCMLEKSMYYFESHTDFILYMSDNSDVDQFIDTASYSKEIEKCYKDFFNSVDSLFVLH